MAFKIFYSWQSTTKGKYNRYFIKECLENALDNLKNYYNNEVEFELDHDTKETPGYPNIVSTIQNKIKNECDIYVGDFSIVDRTSKGKGVLNPNVQNEIGIAQGSIGDERIIVVMNHYYGDPGKETLMNFDLVQYRHPIGYNYGPENDTSENRVKQKKNLIESLEYAIKLIFDSQQERLKHEYYPFETWKTWDSISPKALKFIVEENIETVFESVKDNLSNPSILRVLGLSGIGKTKLLLECFRPGVPYGVSSEISDRILYANLNNCDLNEVYKTIFKLVRDSNRKIIILDNCTFNVHEELVSKIGAANSNLSFITISPEPDESRQYFDPSGNTEILKLTSQNFKNIVRLLLEENFDLTPEEIDLIIEFSNGLPLYAVLMAQNKTNAILQPGSITNQTLLERLLGHLFSDLEKRKVLLAASIFLKFGYRNGDENQFKALALNDAICPLDMKDEDVRIRFFKKVCEELRDRNILEDVGFSVSFRPTPLALKLAEQWWNTCSVEQFKQILPTLQEYNLVESFCKQFQLLPQIEHAKEIVNNLCDGVFSSAEVLNSKEGSRIFRSFVSVNPEACIRSLSFAFQNYKLKDYLNIIKGRRNLVWSLEKLCYYQSTFFQSADTLSNFAVAENENIANNAYSQFLQLFHVYLPGTQTNLYSRIELFNFLYYKGPEFLDLSIDSASRALKSDSFMRFNTDSTQNADNDYIPTQEEIKEYWNQSLLFLEMVLINHPEKSGKIYNILIDKLFELSIKGAFEMVFPFILNGLESGRIDWLTLRNKLLFLRASNKFNDEKNILYIDEIIEKITPDDYISQLKMYIINPSTISYRKREETDEIRNKIIADLAIEFFHQRDKWDEIFSLISTGRVVEGLNFGIKIAERCNNTSQYLVIITKYTDLIIQSSSNIINSFFIGLIRGGEVNRLITVFDLFYNNRQKQDLLFTLIANTDLPIEYISKSLNLIREEKVSIKLLLNFEYGWGIKHLSPGEKLNFLSEVYNLSESGKAMSFLITSNLSLSDDAEFTFFKEYLKAVLLKDLEIVIRGFQTSFDFHIWSEITTKLLAAEKNEKLAKRLIEFILLQSSGPDVISGRWDFEGIIHAIKDNYFTTIWSILKDILKNPENYKYAQFTIRDLFGPKESFNNYNQGVIFNDDMERTEVIRKWVEENPDIEIYRIGELLPIFHKNKKGETDWHPATRLFIDNFGNREDLLLGIDTNMGSYSWVGSVIERFKDIERMYRDFLDHPIKQVRDWANANLKASKERIEWHNDKDLNFI